MKNKILFVNACMRGEQASRTHWLCRAFLEGREFDEVDLTSVSLPCFTGKMVEQRERLKNAGETQGEMFVLARQFAAAEEILIGAPYWDLSFPAALKVYIEHISVSDITFETTPTGTAGLCRAKKLTYITTVGGYIGGDNHGADYFRGLCGFFGIPEFEAFAAEGLDIETNDAAWILRKAEDAIRGSICPTP